MENRVYYGEYSLEHWINLILKRNIILPDYQRFFVWNEKKVETLIDTLKKKQFVPPVTIGAFKLNDVKQNLILDGQQRLTSILLAYLGLYPDAGTYKSTIEKFANDNDDGDAEEVEVQLDNILEWNFEQLTEKGKNRQDIIDKIMPGNYKNIDLDVQEDFLKTTFLGFSYLVPQVLNENEQQKYYSSVFRNINIQGEPLLPQESRASLYFLDKDLVALFAPDFSKKVGVKNAGVEAKIDFVRYLSLLSHYRKDGSASRVARSFKPKMEQYYEEYILASINNYNSTTYGKFTDIFPNKEYSERISNLENTYDQLEIPKTHPSIIDADVYLFGLIYHVVLGNGQVDFGQKEELINELTSKIKEFKDIYTHRKSPNNLGNLRERISNSIEVYGRYIA